MKHLIVTGIAVLGVALLASCNKKPTDPVGGKGGNAELRVTPYHHNAATNQIFDCKVYIKYNTLDMPANGVYDDSATCSNVNDSSIAVFTNLNKGDYYIYGKGYDPNILQDVKGGIPYRVKEENKQTVMLPVTEEH